MSCDRDLDRDIYGAILLPTAAGPPTITPPSNNTSLRRCSSKRGLLPVSMSALPLETSILYCHSPSTLDSTRVKQCIFLLRSLPPVMLVVSCLSLSVAPSPPKNASDPPAVLYATSWYKSTDKQEGLMARYGQRSKARRR